MKIKRTCYNKYHIHNGSNHSSRRGPSSFGMHDSKLAFECIKIQEGDTFLDLGCGAGDYSLYAAKLVGESGSVYSLDIGEEMLEGIRSDAEKSGLKNICTMVADVFKLLPVKEESVDVCMIATVLHYKNILDKTGVLFGEIRRVLKRGGRLAIIECKKEEMPFGPPLEFRVAPEELDKALFLYGFKKIDYVDLGVNYMVLFE
uniref:class I SAM-dependent methyltransferase n=1 Tax=uncultured Draconibacterium sp. TaxID=1573823 RepID=UPI003216F928